MVCTRAGAIGSAIWGNGEEGSGDELSDEDDDELDGELPDGGVKGDRENSTGNVGRVEGGEDLNDEGDWDGEESDGSSE